MPTADSRAMLRRRAPLRRAVPHAMTEMVRFFLAA